MNVSQGEVEDAWKGGLWEDGSLSVAKLGRTAKGNTPDSDYTLPVTHDTILVWSLPATWFCLLYWCCLPRTVCCAGVVYNTWRVWCGVVRHGPSTAHSQWHDPLSVRGSLRVWCVGGWDTNVVWWDATRTLPRALSVVCDMTRSLTGSLPDTVVVYSSLLDNPHYVLSCWTFALSQSHVNWTLFTGHSRWTLYSCSLPLFRKIESFKDSSYVKVVMESLNQSHTIPLYLIHYSQLLLTLFLSLVPFITLSCISQKKIVDDVSDDSANSAKLVFHTVFGFQTEYSFGFVCLLYRTKREIRGTHK
jgi:hypothetical protein